MTQIVLQGKENQRGFSVYDPTMGSGSLLLNAKNIQMNRVLFIILVGN